MYRTNKILNLKIIKISKYAMKYNAIFFFLFSFSLFWVCPHHDPNNMAEFFTKFLLHNIRNQNFIKSSKKL